MPSARAAEPGMLLPRRGLRTLDHCGNEADADYQALKSRQRLERDSHLPNLALRVHRALSWLKEAQGMGHFADASKATKTALAQLTPTPF